jgi:hypothetical protein
MFVDCCDKLFELYNGFATENTRKKPVVWPLQMMLLVLCPVITCLFYFVISLHCSMFGS